MLLRSQGWESQEKPLSPKLVRRYAFSMHPISDGRRTGRQVCQPCLWKQERDYAWVGAAPWVGRIRKGFGVLKAH